MDLKNLILIIPERKSFWVKIPESLYRRPAFIICLDILYFSCHTFPGVRIIARFSVVQKQFYDKDWPPLGGGICSNHTLSVTSTKGIFTYIGVDRCPSAEIRRENSNNLKLVSMILKCSVPFHLIIAIYKATSVQKEKIFS